MWTGKLPFFLMPNGLGTASAAAPAVVVAIDGSSGRFFKKYRSRIGSYGEGSFRRRARVGLSSLWCGIF